MSLYTTQTLGFKPETTYATDPIALASTEYWAFGKYNLPWGDFLSEERKLTNSRTGASRYPQDIYFGEYHASGGLIATTINAIPLYYALGKVTNSGAGDPYTHTITHADIGSALPSFTTRTEDANDSVGIYESIPGCYIQNLTTAIDLVSNQWMTYNISPVGTKITTPQFAGASDAGSLKAPNDVTDHFRRDSNFTAKWNATFSSGQYSSGGDDISNDMTSFALTINNDLRPDKPQSQDYPDGYIFGDQTLLVSFDMYRIGSTTKNVYDDFKTMQDNSTKMNMHFKIYQTATHYIQFDLSNIMLSSVKRNNTKGTDQKPTFRCNGQVSSAIIKAVDSLAGATYYA